MESSLTGGEGEGDDQGEDCTEDLHRGCREWLEYVEVTRALLIGAMVE